MTKNVKRETQYPRILVITSSYPLGSGDISGNFIEKQVRNMVNRGYLMYVLAPHSPGAKFVQDEEGIRIYRFPYFYPLNLQSLCGSGGMYFGFTKSFLGKIQMIPYLFMMILYSGIIIRKDHIDLIHTHWIIPQGIAGAFWRKITGIPHLTTSHVLDITITNHFSWLRSFIQLVLKGSDSITVNSSFTREQVLKFTSSLKPITIIPMGIDDSWIPFEIQETSGIKNGHSILFVGRIIEWKGVDVLIHAVQLVSVNYPDVLLTIIGEGPCRKKYENLVRKIGFDKIIHFPGKVSDRQLKEAYLKSDLFILPSREKNSVVMEGLGVVLLEAMAVGVPVIGSNTGGIPDIIEDNVNGLLVPPDNPEALAKAILQIFDNPSMAEQFRKTGLKTVKTRFSWDIISEQFADIYKTVITEYSSDG